MLQSQTKSLDKPFPDGWVAPVLKSKWSPNLIKNYQILHNELGFKDGTYSIPSYPKAIHFIGEGPWSDEEVSLMFLFWTDPVLEESYRIPVITRELFKLYFEEDAERVWNYFNNNDIPEKFTANGRTVTATYSSANGAVSLHIGRKR
ncbi:hypothetical protein OR571_15830 [Psychrobacillus sp. NEAU-3TGS]|uniref:hypothetical protein n=1 Tax=Psychrobacillus sp. NEAU-3TGS TaxID=2995412 RepID=UPI002498322F|nr:hypothetical protein [Psychrobacillus sp. NEAU-3TGS]MDI2588542.1 hypothetical protein [Psychrobacillus sp. NEAU-3TGS]